MGYRSEVYIKINSKYEAEFKFLLKIHKIHWLKTLKNYHDEYTRYLGSDLKWYKGYKEVDAVNHFMEVREDCALIAIGEDDQISAEFGDIDSVGMEVCTETYINGF